MFSRGFVNSAPPLPHPIKSSRAINFFIFAKFRKYDLGIAKISFTGWCPFQRWRHHFPSIPATACITPLPLILHYTQQHILHPSPPPPLHLALHATTCITPKPREPFDINQCIVCQTATDKPLIQNPSNLQKLFDCLKQRAGYKNPYYVVIGSNVNTNKCKYHRSCYSNAMHKNLMYEKHTPQISDDEQPSSTTTPGEKTPIIFTRRKTKPFNSDLCFFCQNTHDEKGRSTIIQVAVMETGVKISNAVKQVEKWSRIKNAVTKNIAYTKSLQKLNC